MSTAQQRDRLTQQLNEQLAGPINELGLDLEAVDLSAAGKRQVLRVAVDRDGGVTMDDIAEVTREVSRVLDDSDLMGQRPYTLEVSSPGVERPLRLPRHWRRNRGRLVKVVFADPDREGVLGRIAESDDDGVVLDVDGTMERIGYDVIRKAKIQVEFKRGED